jgi:hypothetical protein
MGLLSSFDWVRVAAGVACVVVFGLQMSACADESGFSGNCTNMGCMSSIGVTIENLPITHAESFPLTVEVCDGSACSVFTLFAEVDEASNTSSCKEEAGVWCCPQDRSWFSCGVIPGSGAVKFSAEVDYARDELIREIRVTAKAADGKVLMDATPTVTPDAPFYPNGKECGGACYGGEVTVTAIAP